MPGPQPPPLHVTARQRALLEQLVRRQRCSQQLLRRVRIVLLAADGAHNEQIGRELGLYRGTVRTWRERWRAAASRLDAAETDTQSDRDLTAVIATLLADEPRPGAPATFTAEQVVQIIALACEEPQAAGCPISHWTPRELAQEAAQRGLVERISPRSVGRFLKGGPAPASSQSLLAQPRARGPGAIRRGSEGGV
jgi:putative transposase